jgi:hypothetical protein
LRQRLPGGRLSPVGVRVRGARAEQWREGQVGLLGSVGGGASEDGGCENHNAQGDGEQESADAAGGQRHQRAILSQRLADMRGNASQSTEVQRAGRAVPSAQRQMFGAFGRFF